MLIFPNGVDMIHLDVFDFFEDVDGKFDNLIGDGNVHIYQLIIFFYYIIVL